MQNSDALALTHLHFDFSRHSEAVACLRRAVELRPTFAEAHLKLGTLLELQGELKGAVESLRWAIDLRPDYPQARRRLAKCLEQLEGNVNGSAYNSAAMDEVLRQFGENEALADEIDDRLFFVFGTPKSGTWLQMLLDAHPQLRCRPEDQFSFFLQQMPRVVAAYNQTLAEVDRRTANQQADLLDSGDAAFLCAALIRRLLAKGFAEPAVQRSGAKDNAIVRMLPAFSRLFRTSRFVYVVRDPRDVAVSSWFHNLRVEDDFLKRAGNLQQWTCNTASNWAKTVEDVLSCAAGMDGRLLAVRYEDLQAAPEPTLASVFTFLQVQSSPGTLQRCIDACAFDTLSGRGKGDEDRGSFFRKGVCGDWKNHLSGQIDDKVLAIAGEAMARFDYH